MLFPFEKNNTQLKKGLLYKLFETILPVSFITSIISKLMAKLGIIFVLSYRLIFLKLWHIFL